MDGPGRARCEAVMSVNQVNASSPARANNAVVTTNTAGRVTPATPSFKEVMGGSASVLMRGAEAAVRSLPMAPMLAASLRPGAAMRPAQPGLVSGAMGTGVAAEGPGAATGGLGGNVGGVGMENALAQSQEMNLYFLELQERVASENRAYTTMSNVLKARHDTVKNAIGNIR